MFACAAYDSYDKLLSPENMKDFPTHPTQVRHILTLFSAHWLLTLADRLSPLSMVANPRKAPTSLFTRNEKIQLETVTHPGTNATNVHIAVPLAFYHSSIGKRLSLQFLISSLFIFWIIKKNQASLTSRLIELYMEGDCSAQN